MKLHTPDGQALEVRVVGYQFPDSSDYWDGNWIMTAISVSHARGAWSKTDPALLVFELHQLVDWLRAAARGEPVARALDFIEPNLVFEFVGEPGPHSLRVYFEGAYRPEWAEGAPEPGGLWLDFPLSPAELHRAASELSQQLLKFPVRGTPDAN